MSQPLIEKTAEIAATDEHGATHLIVEYTYYEVVGHPSSEKIKDHVELRRATDNASVKQTSPGHYKIEGTGETLTAIPL